MKVISVEDVSKKFILAHDRPRNLADAARGMFQRKQREDFWALKDVSFEVEQGEALGIIGHNGAGKSTMLKLLTGIMQPTKGRIRTRGRVSALIEVGAGFHPEMTGRENIYLNGSILGMTQHEIAAKFDEIVAFAELEKFIDTPVKRYSSGMYARLGFAVAAHVEPEILLVDEVLSVGDAAFQSRCAQRMREIKDAGCTVVFVSHNFSAVAAICDRVIGLWNGCVFADGTPSKSIAAYREHLVRDDAPTAKLSSEPAGSGSPLVITQVAAHSAAGEWQAQTGRPWEIKVEYRASVPVESPAISVRITGENGIVIARPNTVEYGHRRQVHGIGHVSFTTDSLCLLPGSYGIQVYAWDRMGVTPYDHGRHAYELIVSDPMAEQCDDYAGIGLGLIKMPGLWVWPE